MQLDALSRPVIRNPCLLHKIERFPFHFIQIFIYGFIGIQTMLKKHERIKKKLQTAFFKPMKLKIFLDRRKRSNLWNIMLVRICDLKAPHVLILHKN